VGEQYPSASVRGIDLSPIQPIWVPPNVSFLVDDCELDWMSEDYDLVHFRFMVMVLKNCPRVLEHAFKYDSQVGRSFAFTANADSARRLGAYGRADG